MTAVVLWREERFALAGGCRQKKRRTATCGRARRRKWRRGLGGRAFWGSRGASCAKHCRKHRAGHARASKETERDFNTADAEWKGRDKEEGRVVGCEGRACEGGAVNWEVNR